eukprot:TRINITY_DN5659_c0_g4_i1.p1 TRINITY_DN5659_c0_g4~~TRINITY_DN5659_c0_g4_i1.p1  ORF type:complete len:311 (+),score=16.14 TRINITY_DN5659_c0_g4_i1:130-1062(+)
MFKVASLVVYAGIIALTAYLCLLVPSLHVDHPLWVKIYGVSRFSPGKFLYFLFLVISGAIFVNHITLRDQERKFLLVIFSPLLHMLASNFTIQSRDDYIFLGCKGNNTQYLPQLVHGIRCGAYDGLPMLSVWGYNLLYTAGYFVGLHYTYLDAGRLSNIKLNAKHMEQWKCFEWMTILVITLVFTVLFSYCAYCYYVMGRLAYYGIGCVVCFAAVGLGQFLVKEGKVHVHHFNLGMFFFLLIGIQRPVAAFFQGAFAGVMVEGAMRWGFEPPVKGLDHPHHPQHLMFHDEYHAPAIPKQPQTSNPPCTLR